MWHASIRAEAPERIARAGAGRLSERKENGQEHAFSLWERERKGVNGRVNGV